MIKGIIVEGSDCAGKSTLIRTLKTTLSRSGWDVADLGHKNGDQFDRYMQCYLLANKVIFDRGHFSEAAYSEMWRGGCSFSAWELGFLTQLALENFLVVFVHAAPEILKKRYQERAYGQTITVDELSLIQNNFQKLLNHPSVINYESNSEQSMTSVIENIMSRLRVVNLNDEIVKEQSIPKKGNKKEFVLIEGANGSGKSTLSKLLKVSMIGWGVKTLDYKQESPFDRYLKEYALNKDVIFDRGHFSEIVYGNIFRGGKHFTLTERAFLDSYVQERGIVILCEPPISVLADRVSRTTYPKHIHESRLAQVQESFREVINASGCMYYVVNTDRQKDVDDVVRNICLEIKAEPYSAMGWDKPL